MTYNPKKGDIVYIFESVVTCGSAPVYVVTGETKTVYKCVAPNGCVVFKEAREMTHSDDADDRLAFIAGAQTAINKARDEVSEAQKLLELASDAE